MTCTNFLMILAVMVTVTSCSQRQPPYKQSAESSISFINQCVDLASLGIGLQCSGIVCKGEEGTTLSLEQLQVVECVENTDCRTEDTGMECVKGRCDCPPLQAFNVTSCSCQGTARCTQEKEGEEEEKCPEHNGRKCEDRYCSCYASTDYATLLVDPSSLFCLLPSDPRITNYSESVGVGVTALGVLGGLALIVFLSVGGMIAYKIIGCDKGDYVCDQDLSEGHSEEWNHPSSADFKTAEEDIVFTHLQASNRLIELCKHFPPRQKSNQEASLMPDPLVFSTITTLPMLMKRHQLNFSPTILTSYLIKKIHDLKIAL